MSTLADRTDAMAAIEAMAERLRDEYGAEAVILYGSRADGSARPDSDVDLMIIKSDASGGMIERSLEVGDILSDFRRRYDLDAHVATQGQVEGMLAQGNHFVQDVILQGRVLYEDGCFKRYVELARKSYNMNPQESEFPEYWIRIAERDYDRMLILFDNDDPVGAGYYIQQATEKFFKAYLIRQGWRLRRTHDLGRLLDYAVRYDATLEQYRAVCALVSMYHFTGRYPEYTLEAYYPDLPVMNDENVRAALAEIKPLIERLRTGSAKPTGNDEIEQDHRGGP
jgi:HEPN domain-containing protein/predicted nucleotidyltransferase